ncbi:MAG: carbohydrate binding family 9 domain-containing protein [Acidobacteria bacterium]|nr:carbohydrate binding family 9 domain-containing protein [Acidobacteriota bacterium]
MKKLAVILSMLCFASMVRPQEGPTASVVSEPNPPAVKPAVTKRSKVDVPAEKLRPITIPKIDPGITIDGKLDEENWKVAAVFKDFYQTSPGDNITPSKPTETYMMYDEKHLYIAFKCWDEKDKVRATVAKRDDIFGEDNVRLWLDTYNDQRRAYILGFNPLGIQQDGIFTEGRGADFSVDIIMESKGVIEDWGWSVEVKIPFKSLRYSAGKGKMWGFNAARNIDRFNDEFDQWLPDDRNVSGFLVKHGKITGLDSIKYERTLEVVPSITVSETGSRKRTLPNRRSRSLAAIIRYLIRSASAIRANSSTTRSNRTSASI